MCVCVFVFIYVSLYFQRMLCPWNEFHKQYKHSGFFSNLAPWNVTLSQGHYWLKESLVLLTQSNIPLLALGRVPSHCPKPHIEYLYAGVCFLLCNLWGLHFEQTLNVGTNCTVFPVATLTCCHMRFVYPIYSFIFSYTHSYCILPFVSFSPFHLFWLLANKLQYVIFWIENERTPTLLGMNPVYVPHHSSCDPLMSACLPCSFYTCKCPVWFSLLPLKDRKHLHDVTAYFDPWIFALIHGTRLFA